MRSEIEKIIYTDIKTEGEETDASIKTEAFKSYAERVVVGKKILSGMLQRTLTDSEGIKHFILDDVENRTGFLSDVYGCTGVFSLINRMEADLSDENKNDITNLILWIFQYIKKNGYTLDPFYNDREGTTKLFDKGRPFIGAMTWSLSLLVSIRKAVKNGEFNLDEESQEFIVKQIINIINSFNDYAIHEPTKDGSEGKCIGWSFSKDCLQPSLFYTYSVLEAYSDFEDSVLLSTFVNSDDVEVLGDDELKERIMKDSAYPNALETWRANCMSSAMNVWDKAKDYIKDQFIGDNFFTEDNVVPTISESDIMKSTTSNALFNTLFVVFTAIYGYVNKKGQDANAENDEDVIKLMQEALQNVQATYEMLSSKGIEYIVDTYSLLFQTVHIDKERGYLYSSRLNTENIFDSSLIPMLVKSNSMMAFYIQKYPQKQMGILFDSLFNKISTSGWVWDINKYNVKNTERYLEAVADFYDYYDEYERAYVIKKGNNQKEIERKVNARLGAREKELRKRIKQDLESAHQKEIEELKSSYAFENIFRAQVELLLEEGIEKKILTTIDNIINAHLTKKTDNLSSFEKEFEEKIIKLAISYVDSHLHANSVQTSVPELEAKLMADINEFLKIYAKKLSITKEGYILSENIFSDKE